MPSLSPLSSLVSERISPSLTQTRFVQLLNLYQTAHSNLSPFSTSRDPSMMISITEIILGTKPSDEHVTPHKKRFSIPPCPENTTYIFLQRDIQTAS